MVLWVAFLAVPCNDEKQKTTAIFAAILIIYMYTLGVCLVKVWKGFFFYNEL